MIFIIFYVNVQQHSLKQTKTFHNFFFKFRFFATLIPDIYKY